jgi:hypothetical protein
MKVIKIKAIKMYLPIIAVIMEIIRIIIKEAQEII